MATTASWAITAIQVAGLKSHAIMVTYSLETIMFAITFDLDTDTLKNTYHNDSYGNAYKEVRSILTSEFGFIWQQGSVYFGSPDVDAVTCVLAAQELASRLPWFAPSVRDIRMLKIEDNNDLAPAIQRIVGKKKVMTNAVSKLKAV
jgi:virulence-associated protein VapD